MRSLAVVLVASLSSCQCLVPVMEDGGVLPDAAVAHDAGLHECTSAADCSGTAPVTDWCDRFTGGDGGGAWSCIAQKCVAQCAQHAGQTCSQDDTVECLRCPPTGWCVPPTCDGYPFDYRVESAACREDAGLHVGTRIRQQAIDGGCDIAMFVETPNGERSFGVMFVQRGVPVSARVDALGGVCIVRDLATGVQRVLLECPKCHVALSSP